MVIDIKGDLLETDCKVIAHGVNCQNAMGSGVAKLLFTKWPKVKEKYHQAYKGLGMLWLGDIHYVEVEPGKHVINCYTQEHYGYDGKKYVSYDAIYDCFYTIARTENEIAIPRIGCGLAGGNWEVVKQIINDAVGDKCKVYAYYLEEK